jgi:NAD kinase
MTGSKAYNFSASGSVLNTQPEHFELSLHNAQTFDLSTIDGKQ